MKMFLVMLSVLFLFPFGAGATTLFPDDHRMVLELKWVPGENFNFETNDGEMDLEWSFSTNSGMEPPEVVPTWFHPNQVMNFEIRINPEEGLLNFVFQDRVANHGTPSLGTGFEVDLPDLPTAWFPVDKFVIPGFNLDRVNTSDFEKGNVVGIGRDVYLFDDNFNKIHGLSTVNNAGSTFQFIFTRDPNVAVVPEPGTSIMMFLGLFGLCLVKRK